MQLFKSLLAALTEAPPFPGQGEGCGVGALPPGAVQGTALSTPARDSTGSPGTCCLAPLGSLCHSQHGNTKLLPPRLQEPAVSRNWVKHCTGVTAYLAWQELERLFRGSNGLQLLGARKLRSGKLWNCWWKGRNCLKAADQDIRPKAGLARLQSCLLCGLEGLKVSPHL